MGLADAIGSGAFFDDYTYTIHDAFFAPDASYNNGETLLLQLFGEAIDNEGEIMTTENSDPRGHREVFSVGNGWLTSDGGKKIVSTTGKGKIHPSTMYARLIQDVLTLPGAIEALEPRGEATDASIWIGTRWHMMVKTIEFPSRSGQALNPVKKAFPDQFLGVVPSQEAIPFQAPAVPASTIPPPPDREAMIAAAKAKANGTAGPGDDLMSLAKSSPTWDDFVRIALDMPSVVNDNSIMESVMDAGSTGFYAINHP